MLYQQALVALYTADTTKCPKNKEKLKSAFCVVLLICHSKWRGTIEIPSDQDHFDTKKATLDRFDHLGSNFDEKCSAAWFFRIF